MESKSKLAVVIMAAGKGTRLKSKRPKVLHEIGGMPLLSHVIAAASRIAPPQQIYVVVGHQAERVQKAVEASGVRFVEQTEQLGTGHAIQCCREAIAGYENVLVLSGDVPLIRAETIEQVWRFHSEQKAAMTILSAAPADPFGYGRIVRKSANSPEVEAIVEQKALSAEQQKIGEINSGIYAFQTAALLAQLGKLNADNAHGELYLTDVAKLMRAAGQQVVVTQAAEAVEVLGANTIAELVALDATLRATTANRLMAEGVTIFRPETCLIDSEVEVGPDTVIEPFVHLRGRTRIGSDCLIRSFSVIQNCTLGDAVEVLPSSIMTDSSVDNGARIGPFSHLRPGSEIGEEAHVGNFVETKKTKLGKGAKANHLSYLGDAEVGDKSNIGAGTITCNYDGFKKHITRIGKDAFVGSDTTLVAPVTIEDGAFIGAGSCITKTVPADALAVSRARQIAKKGWAKTWRALHKKKE